MAEKKWRLGWGNEGNILSAIEAGILDGSDLIITKDTKRVAFVRPNDEGVLFTKSRLETFDNLSKAQEYASSDVSAYVGELISVLVNGKYKTYRLQEAESGYELEDIENQLDGRQCVQIVSEFPEYGQEEGVIYIVGTTGKIWNGSEWVTIFEDIQTTEEHLKQYVQELVTNLNTVAAPSIIDNDNPLPEKDYKAGQSWRVAEDGIYCGHKCEIGDLIICVADFVDGQASDNDFIVVQANIDGAVTGTESSTDGEIVVFSGVSGKVLKNSGINIEALSNAISKVHEHSNKEQLDSFTKTQDELLDEVNSQIIELKEEFSERLIHNEPYVTETELIANGYDIIIEKVNDTTNKAMYFINGAQKFIEFPVNFKVIGGAMNDNCHSSSIVMNSGDVRILSGGSLGDGNVTTTTIVINGGKVRSILGGGYASIDNTGKPNHVGRAKIVINNADEQIDQVFGGGFGLSSVGESEIIINDGSINYLTSGGSNGLTSNGNVYVHGGTVQVLQSVNRGVVGTAEITVDGGCIVNAYAGVEPDDGDVMTTATGTFGHVEMHLLDGVIQGLHAGANNSIKDFEVNGLVSGYYNSNVLADESQGISLGLSHFMKEYVNLETVNQMKEEAITTSQEYVNSLMTLTEF